MSIGAHATQVGWCVSQLFGIYFAHGKKKKKKKKNAFAAFPTIYNKPFADTRHAVVHKPKLSPFQMYTHHTWANDKAGRLRHVHSPTMLNVWTLAPNHCVPLSAPFYFCAHFRRWQCSNIFYYFTAYAIFGTTHAYFEFLSGSYYKWLYIFSRHRRLIQRCYFAAWIYNHENRQRRCRYDVGNDTRHHQRVSNTMHAFRRIIFITKYFSGFAIIFQYL